MYIVLCTHCSSTAWDSSFLDAIDRRLQRVEHKLSWFADRFICEGHPLAVEGGHAESVAGGLRNITNRSKQLPTVGDVVEPVFKANDCAW